MQDAFDPQRSLCGLKLRGFIEIIDLLLDREAPEPDAEGNRTAERSPYRAVRRGDLLRVWSRGNLVLEIAGETPVINQLGPRDLLEISRLRSRLG